MYIGGFQGLAFRSNADALISRREQFNLRGDGVVLVWITAICTLFAVAAAVTMMEFNPDLFLTVAG